MQLVENNTLSYVTYQREMIYSIVRLVNYSQIMSFSGYNNNSFACNNLPGHDLYGKLRMVNKFIFN